MREFLRYLKKGKFMIPTCGTCETKAWPPSHRCPRCLSETSLKRVDTKGTLLEFTKSHVKDKEGIFGLVEMGGIRLIGSFSTAKLRIGMEVRMKKCGIKSDGSVFYLFVPAKTRH